MEKWVLATAVVFFLLVAGSTLLLFHSPASAGDTLASTVQSIPTKAPWFLGAVTNQQATAQDVVAEFFIPRELPSVADTYYPLIMSAYDSNSSYDQIGIIAQYGKWAVTTSSTIVNGSTTVYNSLVWRELPSGYYWFRMGVSGGVVTYTVTAENGSVLLNEEARTGGGYFLISPTFLDKYTSNSYAGYTIFEEVYNATSGAPSFNLFCRESYFVSNTTEFRPLWTEYRSGNVPAGPGVSINSSSVIIRNVSPVVTLSSDKSQYYTKEPIALSADAIGAVGEVTYGWYVDGQLSATTPGSEFNLTLGTASDHSVQVEALDVTGALASNVLELAVTKISLTISSELGTVAGAGLYDFGDVTTVSVTPTAIPTGAGTRVALTGWRSDSPDGYVGSNQSFMVSLTHNITEIATWANQSLVSFRSDPAGLVQDAWYTSGPENITLPAVWSNDSYSRMSLTGFSIDGTFTPTGREGWVFSMDLEGPVTLILSGSKQYGVILEGYYGPYNSSSQTGDLWFDSGSDAVVSLPTNYTKGMVRTIFVGWAGGSANNTVSFPAIDQSHSLTPELRTQYFVYVSGSSLFSPIPVELEQLPLLASGGYPLPPGSKVEGAWFDEGATVPLAVESWSQSGVNDSRLVLTSVAVSFMFNVSNGSSIIFVTNGQATYFGTYSLVYGAVGGGLNASSGRAGGFTMVFENGTVVAPSVPSDEMPKIVGGKLVVDRPYYLSYGYTSEFYFNLSTPFGGFQGWVGEQSLLQPSGTFSYSAPNLAGFLGTQRFAEWLGTVNSTSSTLSLTVVKPYVETAYYVTDVGAVGSVVMAAAALVIGGYFMLRERRRKSAAG